MPRPRADPVDQLVLSAAEQMRNGIVDYTCRRAPGQRAGT